MPGIVLRNEGRADLTSYSHILFKRGFFFIEE